MNGDAKKKTEQGAGSGVPLRLSLEDIPEAVVVIDGDNVVIGANDTALKLLGYSREDLDGLTTADVLPGNDARLREIAAGSVAVDDLRISVNCHDGRSVPVDFVAMPLWRNGRFLALVLFGRDVRVRNLMEGEMRKARDYFRSIVDMSPNGICITDKSGGIMIANHSAEAITGYGADELIGGNVSVFYPDDADHGVDVETLRKSRILKKEFDFRRKTGGVIPVQVTYRLMEGMPDVGEAIIESYLDLTDRRRLDQLKNEFVFVAAHELRNPVTAMRLLLDMFREDKRVTVSDIADGYLSKMEEATMRLIQLVDDLLEVSRSEAGKLKIEVGPLDMIEHVRTMVDEMQSTALAKDVVLVYKPAVRLPLVLADSAKLKEVLSNLISNAIKYNSEGGSVIIEHELDSTGMIVTRIMDTGIGMSEEDVNRTFTKFWRSEDVAVRAQAGTGLGLFIVKELMERMGGKISVRSQKDKGTTFTFTLPVAGR